MRQLIAQRNEERMEQVLGELKAARAVSDVAYAAVVMFTNAYAMPDPPRTRAAAADDEEPEQPAEPAE